MAKTLKNTIADYVTSYISCMSTDLFSMEIGVRSSEMLLPSYNAYMISLESTLTQQNLVPYMIPYPKGVT